MGYRSQVCLALAKETYLNTILKKNMPKVFTDKYCERENNDKTYFFTISAIKWYTDYPAVVEAEEFMDIMDYNEESENYGFIRIGEDDDDIESRGSPWEFDMYVSKEIYRPL